MKHSARVWGLEPQNREETLNPIAEARIATEIEGKVHEVVAAWSTAEGFLLPNIGALTIRIGFWSSFKGILKGLL